MHAARSVLARIPVSVLMPVVMVLLTGCSGVANPSNNAVDTFNGTVTPEGSPTTFSFTANRNGEMSVRFTAISPNSASLIGVAAGQQVAGGCSIFNLNNLTGLNRDTLIMPINKGNYCLQVFNGGGVAAAQTYTVQVSHP